MKINIKTTNIGLDEALLIWVNKKIGELDRFLGSFGPDEFSAGEREKVEVWVEIGKTTKHHLKGEIFRAEAQIYLPNKKLRVVATDADLRTAINVAKELLQAEIQKYKGRRLARARGWARKTKEALRASEITITKQGKNILRILRLNRKH